MQYTLLIPANGPAELAIQTLAQLPVQAETKHEAAAESIVCRKSSAIALPQNEGQERLLPAAACPKRTAC
jgi:hypothetical protein